MSRLDLRPNQTRAVQNILNDRFHGVFQTPGAGKTAIVLKAISDLQEVCDIRRALIIAPLRVIYTTWPDESRKWDQFRHLRLRNLHETSRKDELGFNVVDPSRDGDIFMINFEGLPRLFGRPIDQETSSGGVRRVWHAGPWANWAKRPEMLIVDESTRMKDPQALCSRTLAKYLGDFNRRVILTGTPAPNGLQDLFGQMLILDRGETLGNRVTAFREKFFTPVPMKMRGKSFNQYAAKDGAMATVQNLIKPHVTVIESADWLKMPDRITVDVPVHLPEKAAKLYKQAKQEAFAQLESGDHFFATGGAAIKLKQIANGQVYIGEKPNRRVAVVHREKADALATLLEELGRPALVAYEVDADGQYLAKRFKAPVIKGGMAMAETMELIAKWNRRELPMLLVQPQAASHGLNMQAGGDAIVWYTLPWSLETYIQFNARLCRQGQAAPSVMVYHLVASGTVDERVAAVLEGKEATQDALISALKEEIRA